MAQSIDQRVGLSGAEEVKKQLDAIGQSGEAAFKRVGDAAVKNNAMVSAVTTITAKFASTVGALGKTLEPISKNFDRLKDSGTKLGESLRTVGERFGVGLGLGIAGAVTGLFLFIKSSAEAADQVGKTADQLGLSVDAFQKFKFAASQANIGSEQFARGFSKFVSTVAEGAKEQQKALTELAQLVVGTTEQTGTAIVRGGQKTTEEIERATAAASRRLITVSTFASDEITKVAKRIQLAVKEASGVDLPLQNIITKLNTMGGAADTTATKARQLLQTLGVKVQAPTIFESLALNSNAADKALQRLGIDLLDVQNKPRKAEEVFRDLAGAFERMENPIERSRIATEIFGDRIGRKFVNLLGDGTKGLDDMAAKWTAMGVAVDIAQTKVGEGMVDAFDRVLDTIHGVRTQVGLAFAPDLTRLFDAFTAAIARTAPIFTKWGEDIARIVRPAIDGLIETLSDPEASKQFFEGLRAALVSFVDGIKAAVPVITVAFKGIMGVLGGIAEALNFVFGTNLNATSLIAILVIGKISGAFLLISSSISVVYRTLSLLISGISLLLVTGGLPLLLFVGGLALLIGGLIFIWLKWDDIVANAKSTWEGFTELLKSFGGVIRDAFNDAVKWTTDAWNTITTTIQNAITSVTDFFKNLWLGAIKTVSDAWEGLTTWIGEKVDAVVGFFGKAIAIAKELAAAVGGAFGGAEVASALARAHGGPVPGSGTGDTVRALLTPGEFVMRRGAVDHYGARFMAMVNSLRLPKPQEFAMGGLVGALAGIMPAPMAFADGGLLGGPAAPTTILNLTIDGQRIGGLVVPDDVAKAQLVRIARAEALYSAGRKPGNR